MRNPWFSSEVAELRGGVVSMINTSQRVARAAVCYSSGGLYQVPGRIAGVAADLLDVVRSAGAAIREHGVSVERGGSSQFSLKTVGEAVVLKVLRPLEANLRMYVVDSTIRFEGEVAGR